jgi:hypothetical protein
VRDILRNGIYIGEYYLNKWRTEPDPKNPKRRCKTALPRSEWQQFPKDKIPKLMAESTFYEIQSRLEESRIVFPYKSGKRDREQFPFLFQGHLFCG